MVTMNDTGLQFDLLIVFFVYGAAFFTMGLALALEASRSPSLAAAELLIPLAAFGILHGLHEWMEIFLLQIIWLGEQLPDWVSWFRLGVLTISFVLLIIYGVQAFRSQRKQAMPMAAVGLSILALYILFILYNVLLSVPAGQIPALRLTDVLARYLLAVPGTLLASLGLYFQGLTSKTDNRHPLARSLQLAAFGFGIYGLTQIFVPAVDMAPARWISADAFLAATGVPIQVFRAAMAVLVMLAMIHAVRVVEKERQEQLQAAQQARVEALQQIQLELTKREALRRELLHHVVQAQEDERARISRELHDETAQVLSAFSLDLASLQNSLANREKSKVLIERLLKNSKQISQGLYRLVHDLRPAHLDDLGLVPTLQSLCEGDFADQDLDVSVDIQGEVHRLKPILATALFRVAQEGLTNISRHAKVKKARIQLAFTSGQVTMRLMDAGVGFDPSATLDPPRGWGLTGMRERIESVGGKLHIRSAPGEGTTIEVIVPTTEQPAK